MSNYLVNVGVNDELETKALNYRRECKNMNNAVLT